VAGWILVQAASIVFPTFGTPAWALRTLIAITFVGFPVALFVAWFSIPHPYPDDVPKLKGLTPGEFMLIGLLGGVLLLSLAQLAYEFSRSSMAPKQAGASLAPTPAGSVAAGSLRVAVIPFDIIGGDSDATRAFADTLLDKIDGTLAANQVDTVSRADSLSLRGGGSKVRAMLADLRVGLTLEGSVQNDGKTITVRLHLDDVSQHLTLWSREFSGPVDSPEPLQTQVALHATDVTRWAVSPRLKVIRSDPSLVAAYLEGEDEGMNGGGRRSLAIARDLVARAPRFAAAHTLLASTVGQEGGLDVLTPEARAESTREARLAIALDGGDGQAYALIAAHLPARSFKEREELLVKGLSVEPGSASANWDYIIDILAATGRTEEAIAQARTASQLSPFTVWLASALPLVLANAGRIDEARDAIVEMKRKWPDDPDMTFKTAELVTESQRPPFARAFALLDDAGLKSVYEHPPWGKPGTTNVWRTAMKALGGTAKDKQSAARLVVESIDEGMIDPFLGISFLCSLGDVDGAFNVADRNLTAQNIGHLFGKDLALTLYRLFGTQTADMRRDPRFMPLMQRFGLVDYWRSTGHWPDFCSEPGLPYDCKAVAAKLVAAASTGAKH
jgi:TolB-like protein